MPDIKIKEKSNIAIKKFDKAKIYSQKLKDNVIDLKEKANYQNNSEEYSPSEYGANRITETSSKLSRKGIEEFDKLGRKSVKKTKENAQKSAQKIKKTAEKIKKKIKDKSIKTANKTTKKTIKMANKTGKRAIKTTKRTIKTAKRTGKVAYKTTKVTVKTTVKASKRAFQIAKATAKATIVTVKTAIKLTILAVKAIIAATQALIAAIVAGGWIAVLIIIIVCLIALICSSIFGIFFSNEESGMGGRTMSSVVSEINIDFTNKITNIQNTTEHDDYEIKSNRAEWRDVLSVYAVLMTNGNEQSDVVTLDDKKIEKLKNVFWEMNTISSSVENVEKDIEITDENGNTQTEKQTRKVLYINISSKSVDEMILKYNFNAKQKEQLAELQKQEYNSMWSNVLYGSSAGSSDIVQVAFSQIGNVGGQPYWSWYGFNSRVSWCACFVSWCANECGYIDSGIIPKFAACEAEGVTWFKTCGLWQDGGYIPKTRRYYFL